jgi:hypothetical protein
MQKKISDEELALVLERIELEMRWSFNPYTDKMYVMDSCGFFLPFTKKQWWKYVEGPYRIMKQQKPTTTVETVVLIFLKEFNFMYVCQN